MTTYYISSWENFTDGIGNHVKQALAFDKVKRSDIVWTGPSGDAIIAPTAAHLDEEYADYTDAGLVAEWLD